MDDDSLSVQSLDVVREGEDGNEKKNKRRSMVKMSSLFNILSPAAGRKGKTLEVGSFFLLHTLTLAVISLGTA